MKHPFVLVNLLSDPQRNEVENDFSGCSQKIGSLNDQHFKLEKDAKAKSFATALAYVSVGCGVVRFMSEGEVATR